MLEQGQRNKQETASHGEIQDRGKDTHDTHEHIPVNIQFSLSPLEIPAVLERVLFFVSAHSIHPCLFVSQLWFLTAAPIVWRVGRIGSTRRVPRKREPTWDLIARNIRHMHELHLGLPEAFLPTGDLSPDGHERDMAILIHAATVFESAHRLRSLFLKGLLPTLHSALQTIAASTPALAHLTLERAIHADTSDILDNSEDSEASAGHGDKRPIRGVSLHIILDSARMLTTLTFQHGVHPIVAKTPVGWKHSLKCIDIYSVNTLTASDLAQLAQWLPRLQTLLFDISGVSETLQKYHPLQVHGTTSPTALQNLHTASRRVGDDSLSAFFAKDLRHSCPGLTHLGIRYHPYVSKIGMDSVAVVMTRDLVQVYASQLRSLNVWKTVFQDQAAALLAENAISPLERLSIPGNIRNRGLYLSSPALQYIFEKCQTLKVLNIPRSSLCISDMIQTQDPVIHPPYSLLPVPNVRPWTCLHLEFLSLELEDVYASSYSESRPERFRQTKALFRQLSTLASLQVIHLSGFFGFPCDLSKSGFYQLETLHNLRVFSASFEWKELGLTDQEDTEGYDAQNTKTFLERQDFEWIVQHWPRLLLLNLGTWQLRSSKECNIDLIQSWLTDMGMGYVKVQNDGSTLDYDIQSIYAH